MSSHCRSASAALAVVALSLVLGGCERERREYRSAPESAPEPHPRLSTLQPGAPIPETAGDIGPHYEANAFHISQGARWYRWFNCIGCHGAGGGAMGPALMDDEWRYGGRIDQIHASIVEGRPNGMPSWRGKITDQQAWQLAAYVRALSGNVSKAAAPSRREGMAATPPLTQRPRKTTSAADDSAQNPPPQ